MTPIYLDYNATTPVDPIVLEAMLPYLRDGFGNPSSGYALGRQAHAAIEQARAEVAALINAAPEEIIFTGGATEASNIAIRGGGAHDPKRRGIVTTNIEHPATVACCKLLRQAGHPVAEIPATAQGVVPAADAAAAISDSTGLVTIIHAQNEVGTLQPVAEIASLARARGALVHTDAAQSVGKITVDVAAMGVDLLTIAGHKLYAPKGVGVLFVRKGLRLPPVVVGADQEHGRRPGTENVPHIVALGAACRLARENLDATERRLAALTQTLRDRLRSAVPGLHIVGEGAPCLPNTSNVIFPGVSGRKLLEACPDVMASTGSACHADSEDPSPVLSALGLPRATALGAVRLSLGRGTTTDQIHVAANALAAAWMKTRTT